MLKVNPQEVVFILFHQQPLHLDPSFQWRFKFYLHLKIDIVGRLHKTRCHFAAHPEIMIATTGDKELQLFAICGHFGITAWIDKGPATTIHGTVVEIIRSQG